MTLAAAGFSFGGLDARVHLLWPVLLFVVLAFRARRKRREALRHFAPEGAEGLDATARRRRLRTLLTAGGLLLLIFAALQPRSNPVKVRGRAEARDLVVLLDVSKSMLAEDRKPNRLESVKLEIARLIDRLDGDRIGIIAFAGEAVVVSPLTSNYSYVKRALRTVSPRTAGQGGTRIGDAIRKATYDLLNLKPAGSGDGRAPAAGETVLDGTKAKRKGRYADILLFTDGEDHDSVPEYAARALREYGVGLYVVGVGSPEGRPIPVAGDFLRYKGEIVRSALQGDKLRALVVEAGRGSYLPASVHHFDLVKLYDETIANDEGRAVAQERIEWQEVYQPFLIAGLVLLLLALATPLAPARSALRTGLVVLLLAVTASAAEPLGNYNEGVRLLAEGGLDEALRKFEAAAVEGEGPVRASALLNLGLCRVRLGDAIRKREGEEESREDRAKRLAAAAEHYRSALAIFRGVRPPAPDADEGAKAAKVRLLAVLDEIAKLAAESREQAEEEALKDPPALLLRMLTEERDRRRIAARLAGLTPRRRRLPTRRLRRVEHEARTLVEKLASAIEEERAEAKKATGEAAEAMAQAVGRLHGFDPAAAREEQTRAIAALGRAAALLPAPVAALVAKLLDDQGGLLAVTKAKDPALVVDEQREIGVWLGALSRLEDPPPGGEQGRAPGPETAPRIRALAGEALAAAGRAEAHLRAERLPESEPEQHVVIEKLEAIRDLLPKPPPSPAERIRKLLAGERKAKGEIVGLAGLNEEARSGAEKGLAESQRTHARTATSIAAELTASPGENEKAAAEKVTEAETEIFASAEELDRDRVEPASGAADRAIAALEEALDRLSGDRGPPPAGEPPPPKDGGEQNRDEEPQRLGPREARRMMEEMDRDRREEERKLFSGGGGMMVDKDW